MNIRKIVPVLMMALLMTGNVYAVPEKSLGSQNNGNNGNRYAYSHYKIKGGNPEGGTGSPYVAPEIDAKSGISAMVLLVGILLLTSERSRSKRQPKEATIEDEDSTTG